MKKAKSLLNLVEGSSSKINPTIKNAINRDLKKINDQTYFASIPISDIFNILKKYGVIAVQKDGTEWEGFLMGGINKTEQVYFNVADMNVKEDAGIFKTVYRYTNIFLNTQLALSYYKMPSGKYEIITYLT